MTMQTTLGISDFKEYESKALTEPSLLSGGQPLVVQSTDDILTQLRSYMVEEIGESSGTSGSSLARVLGDNQDEFYDEDEVQNLFTHCLDVVNRISREMKS